MRLEILEQEKIPYTIKCGRFKNFRMHYNSNNVLIINLPFGIKEKSLEEFVLNNINWIKEKYKSLKEKSISYESGSVQKVFGKDVTLIVNFSKTPRIDYTNDILMVSVKTPNDIKKDVIKWRYDLSHMVFEQIFYKCFEQMSKYLVKCPKITIKESKTKWGCCYYNENRIMLNLALTQAPFHLIEYVIYHELCHFIVHNHSKEFHEFLRTFVPNEKECIKELKEYNCKLK